MYMRTSSLVRDYEADHSVIITSIPSCEEQLAYSYLLLRFSLYVGHQMIS